MLVDLMSRCNILGAAASCKYSKPLAAPKATWMRVAQLSGSLPWFASKHSRKFPFDMYSNANNLSYFLLWYSQQYPIKGTTWQWLSLDIISICAQFKLGKTDYCCVFLLSSENFKDNQIVINIHRVNRGDCAKQSTWMLC